MVKFILYFSAVVVLFSVGYRTGQLVQENEQAYNEAYLRQVYEKKQDDIIRTKDEAINLLKEELHAQSIANSSMQSTVDRLQHNLSESARRLSNARDSCQIERDLLGQCVGLLGEGADLLKQGTSLLRETATNNDTLIKLMQKPNSIK